LWCVGGHRIRRLLLGFRHDEKERRGRKSGHETRNGQRDARIHRPYSLCERDSLHGQGTRSAGGGEAGCWLVVGVGMKVTLVGGKSRRPLGSLRRPGLNSVIGSSYPDVTLRLFPIYISLYIPIQNLLTPQVILSG